jgi:hypothetical protein
MKASLAQCSAKQALKYDSMHEALVATFENDLKGLTCNFSTLFIHAHAFCRVPSITTSTYQRVTGRIDFAKANHYQIQMRDWYSLFMIELYVFNNKGTKNAGMRIQHRRWE